MTVDELRSYPKEILTPVEAAGIIGCSPHGLRLAARENPEALGFPVMVIGHRVKIPKRGLIRFMEGCQNGT